MGTGLAVVFAFGIIVVSSAQAHIFRTQGATSAFLEAEADATGGNQVFTTNGGGSVSCTGIKFGAGTATVVDKATSVTAHPEYSGCKVAGLVNTSVTTTECNYAFAGETNASAHAKITIICGPLKVITFIKILGCTLTVGAQELTGVHYNNIATGAAEKEMHITVQFTLGAIKYKTEGCASLLGEADGEHTGATYTGNVTVKGFEDNAGVEGAGQVGITVE